MCGPISARAMRKGQIDRTHLNAKGSEVVGRMVVEALRKVVPELAPMLRVQPADFRFSRTGSRKQSVSRQR